MLFCLSSGTWLRFFALRFESLPLEVLVRKDLSWYSIECCLCLTLEWVLTLYAFCCRTLSIRIQCPTLLDEAIGQLERQISVDVREGKLRQRHDFLAEL